MPLHKGLPYTVEHLLDLKPDEQVFVVPDTKEACREYEDYLAVLKEYRSKVWFCNLSGRGPYTYLEAQASEEEMMKQVTKVNKAALEIVPTLHFPRDLIGSQ